MHLVKENISESTTVSKMPQFKVLITLHNSTIVKLGHHINYLIIFVCSLSTFTASCYTLQSHSFDLFFPFPYKSELVERSSTF